ncbi:cytoplasmic dynein 1 intermediate chain 1 [Sminthopsis crassicaudata]|uniref:cytoplasmic dynein 1 intermediate chain 1 n=1 Tax=Sminthopsis crassicaudata TaxID=9301 RepID=UPI003D697A73
MSDKSDLKAELERKKQRLAQIREEKKRKEEERKKKEADLQQKKEPAPEDSDLDRKRRETEALLQSIGISPEPPLVPTPMSPSSKSASTPSEAGSQDSGDLGPLTSCLRTLQWDTDPSVLQLQTDSEIGRRLHKLGVSKVTQVDFLPREVVSYCKETQTPLDTHQSEGKRRLAPTLRSVSAISVFGTCSSGSFPLLRSGPEPPPCRLPFSTAPPLPPTSPRIFVPRALPPARSLWDTAPPGFPAPARLSDWGGGAIRVPERLPRPQRRSRPPSPARTPLGRRSVRASLIISASARRERPQNLRSVSHFVDRPGEASTDV